MEIRETIRDFILSGSEVVGEASLQKKTIEPEKKSVAEQELDSTSEEIINILEEYVKPAVASDGGNILFQSYEPDTKTVSVVLQGACSGCPSSTFTLKNGIETMLKNMLGDKVEEVVALNG
jgi:Fe-S cluster biogenesis protein NfuA